MSRVRLLIARLDEDETPFIAGGVNEAVWEHDEDDTAMKALRESFDPGGQMGYDFVEVWCHVPQGDLNKLFVKPDLDGAIRKDASPHLYDEYGIRLVHCERRDAHERHGWVSANEDLRCPGIPGGGEE